jgi:hypothetical protein
MKFIFASLAGFSLFLASCGGSTKSAAVSGWGDATEPSQPPRKCDPFYVSNRVTNMQMKFFGFCEEENMHFGFRFTVETSTSELLIKSTDYPSHTAKLDKILRQQVEEGLGSEYFDLLRNVVRPLLLKGDPESLKEAHRIYLEALLK